MPASKIAGKAGVRVESLNRIMRGDGSLNTLERVFAFISEDLKNDPAKRLWFAHCVANTFGLNPSDFR